MLLHLTNLPVHPEPLHTLLPQKQPCSHHEDITTLWQSFFFPHQHFHLFTPDSTPPDFSFHYFVPFSIYPFPHLHFPFLINRHLFSLVYELHFQCTFQNHQCACRSLNMAQVQALYFSIRPLTYINVHSSFKARDIYYYQKLHIFNYLQDYQQPCSLWSTIYEVYSTIKKLQHFRGSPSPCPPFHT